MGRTVAELENTLSAREYRGWLAFYGLDPFGEQRADIRMARLVAAVRSPHVRVHEDPRDFMPFPDDAHDIPDDVGADEREMMLKLSRLA